MGSEEKAMRDESKVCCSCRMCIRDGEQTYCLVDGHYIRYVECFEGWCRHWARDKKWDKEEENNG